MIFVVVIEGIPVHAFFLREDAMAYIFEYGGEIFEIKYL